MHTPRLQILLLLGCVLCRPNAPQAQGLTYAIGADLSYLKMQEDRGVQFRDSGRVEPGLLIFKQHGYGWIRLRLFHTPSAHADRMPNDLPYTIALAQQAKSYGFKFLLDYHYSDSWADPGKQWPPASWTGLSHAVLTDSVYRYTRATMTAFRQAGVWPDMVQIGNEITPGMLWDDGRIISNNFLNLSDLIKAGVRGVDSARATSPRPLIMLHLDRGGDWAVTRWWFDGIIARGVAFDVIGQSYYPEWHGTLNDLRNTFNNMGNTYAKDVILVEIALLGTQAGFPLTNQGQVDFLRAADQVVRATPNGRGKGIFWWEPTNSPGSPGDTRNFFTASRDAKPVINVFDAYATSLAHSRSRHRVSTRLLFPSGIWNGNGFYGWDGRLQYFTEHPYDFVDAGSAALPAKPASKAALR